MLPDVPVHIIQRGNNRQACFATAEDFQCYLGWLKEYADATGCRIHAFVLMTNHVHLLLSADKTNSAAELMKRLGQRYVQYFNRAYLRSGTLWEGRFRSALIQDEAYLLSCMRYIELNPLRASMVSFPDQYLWSSYRANALGEASALIKPHELYTQLGKDDLARQSVYRDLCAEKLDTDFMGQIRKATNGNVVLGNDQFADKISKLLGARVTSGKPGRPKVKDESSVGLVS
jgi:putative transposase